MSSAIQLCIQALLSCTESVILFLDEVFDSGRESDSLSLTWSSASSLSVSRSCTTSLPRSPERAAAVRDSQDAHPVAALSRHMETTPAQNCGNRPLKALPFVPHSVILAIEESIDGATSSLMLEAPPSEASLRGGGCPV